MGSEKCIEGFLPALRLNSCKSTFLKSRQVTCSGEASPAFLAVHLHYFYEKIEFEMNNPFVIVSTTGVHRGSELRLLTELETWWMTLSSTAGLGRLAAECSTCAMLPRQRPPPLSPLLKWSQMRWRVASLCREKLQEWKQTKDFQPLPHRPCQKAFYF